jgi:hypothetical protein
MGTVVLDVNAHGPPLPHCINTGGPTTCEAPSAKKRAAAESSKTFFDLILPQDSKCDFLLSMQVLQSALHPRKCSKEVK